MKRYDVYLSAREIRESTWGEYVKHIDHIAELAEARQEVKRLKSRDEYSTRLFCNHLQPLRNAVYEIMQAIGQDGTGDDDIVLAAQDAAKIITEARARIAALEAQEWRPVSEPPKEGDYARKILLLHNTTNNELTMKIKMWSERNSDSYMGQGDICILWRDLPPMPDPLITKDTE